MGKIMTIFPIGYFSGFTLPIFSNCFSYYHNLFLLTSILCHSFSAVSNLTNEKDQSSFWGLIFPRYILKSRCSFSTFTARLIIFLPMMVHGMCTSHMVCTAGNQCQKCFPTIYLHPDPVWPSRRLLLIPPLYFLCKS